MKNSFRYYHILLILTLGSFGCKQNLNNSSWDVDILAPVIQTRLTMADLLSDSLLVPNAEGALRLKVETPLIDLPLDSILKIPDTTLTEALGVPFPLNVQPGTEIPIPLTSETQYDLGELALSRVVLRTGVLKLKVKSILETAIDFKYKMPTATLFGNEFVASETLQAGSTADTAVFVAEYDLSKYSIDLRGLAGNGFNTLVTDYEIKTSESGQEVSVPGGFGNEFFFLEYSFENLVPDYGKGYFGQLNTSVEDENSEIDVLNRITEGQMFLDSVTIGLTVTNGVGADAQFELASLKSINTRQNSTVDLSHQIVGETVLLTRAQDPNGNAEDVIASNVNYVLDNSNSNIKEFIQNLPDQLGFTFGFDLNPLGNISAGNDFFYYDRPFQALMDIDIPLRTTLTNLTLVDTLEWDLSATNVVESVNSGSFNLIANNGFPLEGSVELIMLDENKNALDTLVAPSTISAPALDADLKVIEPLESRIIIPISAGTADVMPQTRHIHIRARFNTQNQPELIDFYDTYGIDLKLIGNFNLNFGPGSL